ncbi:MAG: thermostable dipeptidase [Actinobacteria bacterium]|nr:thermostable dipeptidase [Actinomycetota bacterium]
MNSLKFADCHNDLLLGVLHQKERGIADPFGDFWLPQLKAGNIVLQVLPVYVEEQFIGEGALRRSLILFENAWQIAELHKNDVAICLNSGDIAKAHAAGKIALILAVEGAEAVGSSLEFFSLFHKMGVRLLSLTWNRRTMFADGVGELDSGGKLTALGREAIAEMERIGIILDVSHISENGFWNVAEIAKRPYVASHSSMHGLKSHPRNLRDNQAKEIVKTDGFIGLNAFGAFLSDNPTIDSMLDHVEYAINLVGGKNVGFGFDFMKDLIDQVDPVLGKTLVDFSKWPFVPGLDRPSDLAGFGTRLAERFGDEIANDVAWRSLADTFERLLPKR